MTDRLRTTGVIPDRLRKTIVIPDRLRKTGLRGGRA
jgi:hypothetical protein